MAELIRTLLKRLEGKEGQALGEFTLVIAFVAVVCIVAVTALGLAILVPFDDILEGF